MVFQNPKADIEGVRGADDILKQASIIIDGLGEEAKENPTMTIQDFIIKIKKVYDRKNKLSLFWGHDPWPWVLKTNQKTKSIYNLPHPLNRAAKIIYTAPPVWYIEHLINKTEVSFKKI